MIDKYDEYVNDKLSAEERDAFEKELQKNPELLKQFVEQRQVDLSLKYLHDDNCNSQAIDAVLADIGASDDAPLKKSVLNEIDETTDSYNDYINDELSPEKRSDFEKELHKNPELLKQFVEQRQVDLALKYLHDESSNSQAVDAVLADIGAKSDAPFKKSILNEILDEKRNQSKPIWLAISSLAACFLIGFFFFMQDTSHIQVDDEIVVEEPALELVARVVQQKNIKWNDKTTSIKEQGWLSTGKIAFDSGLLKIVFDNGAKVILKGPIDFDLISAERGFLNKGKSWARVPKQARGFTIHTPNSTMIDLGTEFSLNVDEEKKTELHVIKGEVKAIIENEDKTDVHHVKSKQAIAIQNKAKRKKAYKIDFSLQSLANNLPVVRSPMPNYIHYNFDDSQKVIDDHGNYQKRHLAHRLRMKNGKLVGKHITKDDLNTKHKGPFNRSLYFDDNKMLKTQFEGIAGTQARTIAFWIKIDPKQKKQIMMPLVHWGSRKRGGYWLTSINLQSALGKTGAISTQFGGGGIVVGSTDLRDGQWHHVVCMFIGGKDANVASHVRHYIDGKLENISHKRGMMINTSSKHIHLSSQKLNLGYYLHKTHNKKTKKKTNNHLFFQGKMDEFYFFDQVLAPYQIVHLMEHNELITTPTIVAK